MNIIPYWYYFKRLCALPPVTNYLLALLRLAARSTEAPQAFLAILGLWDPSKNMAENAFPSENR